MKKSGEGKMIRRVVVIEHKDLPDPFTPHLHYRRMIAVSGRNKQEIRAKAMEYAGIREGEGYRIGIL